MKHSFVPLWLQKRDHLRACLARADTALSYLIKKILLKYHRSKKWCYKILKNKLKENEINIDYT